MTNLEWLIKDKELLKEVLSDGFAMSNGEIMACSSNECYNCDFDFISCKTERRKWLEAEHEPLYRKGDIVIYDITDELFVVTNDECDNYVTVSRFVNFAEGLKFSVNNIRKKVGSIYD